MALGTAAGAFLLIGMAGLTYVQAALGPGMASDGPLVEVTAGLQHAVAVVTATLAWIPGWVTAVVLVLGTAYIVWQARRHLDRPRPVDAGDAAPDSGPDCCTPETPTSETRIGEKTRP